MSASSAYFDMWKKYVEKILWTKKMLFSPSGKSKLKLNFF